MSDRLIDFLLAWARYRWRLVAGAAFLGAALVAPLWGLVSVQGGFSWFLLAVAYGCIGFLALEGVRYIERRWPKCSLLRTYGPRPVWGSSRTSPAVLKWRGWVARGGWLTAATAAGIGEIVTDESTGVQQYVGAGIGFVHENRRGVLIEVRSGPSALSSLDAVDNAVPVLASHMNADGLALERYGKGQVYGRLVIPHAAVPPLEPLTELPAVDPDTWAVSVGVDDDGVPVQIVPAGNASLLVSGVPGSGKTLAAQVLVGAWRAAGAVVRIGDGKDGGDWDAFGTSKHPVIGDNLDGALKLLHDAERELRERLAAGKASGVPNWWNRSSVERGPLYVLVLDEVQEFLETSGVDKERKTQAEEATRLLTSLVKRGRSAGLFVVMLSQKVDSSAIPTRLRDQCAIRLSGRQMTAEGSRAALGTLNEGDPVPHRDIPANAPGRMTVSGVSDRAQLIQAFYAPPEVLAAAVGGESAGARSAEA